ncbi:GntR family transcriptional regulator [Microbacterium sp. X-17]|uniref:GntR family transcriptional regulator n=1 Tax=Microbacterium sp. X-17 TaxID=3144404 RepID=UPI0031F597B0
MTTGPRSAHENLRAAILSFELLPGEPLSERGLEDALGASRTPIRAALLRLEAEGLTQRAGRGWRVAPIDLAEVRAVLEYREAIEAGAVALAVERAADDELEALRGLVEEGRRDDDEATGLRDGSDFHVTVAQLSGNAFFAEAMRGVLTRLSRTRWLEVRTPEARAHARDEHLGILDAIRERDAARAVALATAHSRGTRDRLLALLADERRRLRGRGIAIVETAPQRAEGMSAAEE